MRTFCFLVFFSISSAFASTVNSQNVKVSLSTKQVTVRQLISEIEKQTNYLFIYNSDKVNLNQLCRVNKSKNSLKNLLQDAFKSNDIIYKVEENNIVLMNKEEIQSSRESVQQHKNNVTKNKITIRGQVKDNTGDLLPGVNVKIKGFTEGTITDINGVFVINVPYENASLIFSYVGYQPKDVALNGKKNIDVMLIEDAKALDDVVVVGYTTQKKATITGSISTITTKDLEQSPTANLTNALAGRMPGLIATQFSGGEPGVDASTLSIRGIGTYGTSAPIIIVDGVERDMQYLSSEEIETFTILKDASATAAYGIRGANGVIIITTKRGKAQEKATVDFKASFGTNNPVKFPKYLGSADYATLYNEAIKNSNPTTDPSQLTLFSDQSITNFKKAKGDNSDGLGYNWDYFKYAFKPGMQEDYSLSIRGGSDRARYYVMADYYQQDGNYKHTNLAQYNTQAIFKRYNFRTNMDIDINKNFYVKVDLGAYLTDRNAPGTTASRIVAICNTQAPFLPITLPDNGNVGNETYVQNNPKGLLYGDELHRYNLLGELSRTGYLNEKNIYLNGSFAIGHKLDFITKGLKIEGTFSYDAKEGRWINRNLGTRTDGYKTYGKYATFQPKDGNTGLYYMNNTSYDGKYILGNPWYDTDVTIDNSLSHNPTQSKTYYQLKLDYTRQFGKHNIYAMALFNRSSRSYDNAVEYRYQGATGRVTYAYDDKYLAEFDAGYNGSENFAPGKRYGLFPAGSVGWVISRENFMQSFHKWLDELKIRASLGLVGSDQLSGTDRFAYLQFYKSGSSYSFGEDLFGSSYSGLAEGNFANKNLTWEKSRKFNIGLDALMLNENLSLTVDYFFEHRYHIITSLSDDNKLGFPDVVGKNAPYVNTGIVNNHGIEFEIGWKSRIGKDFRYYIKPNFSFARNKIIFMNEISYDNKYRANTGKRIGEHFVYQFDHFVNDQAEADKLNAMNNGSGFQPWGTLYPGDVVYKDLNNDGKINDLGDRKNMGNPKTPEIQFGIPFGIQYKGFDLSVLFQGAALCSMQLTGAAVYDFPAYEQDQIGKVKPMHLKRWTEATKDVAKYPRLTYGANSNNKNDNSSLFLYNSAYLRLKTVEIGYTMPNKILRFTKFERARFYIQGMNLLTFDGLKDVDVDPETADGNGNWYPVQRIFNVGIEITY